MTKSKKLQRALKEPISRNEALQRIQSDPEAYSKFIEFPNEHQEKILEFIQGSRGLPIVYDPFFKKSSIQSKNLNDWNAFSPVL